MPVIVIGADTPVGIALVAALQPHSGEIRVFVTDEKVGNRFRGIAKVAVGDLSDGTHVEGVAIGAFCAVVVAAAAHDDRERSFADTPAAVFAQWADGLTDAGIARVVLVGAPSEVPESNTLAGVANEYFFVDTTARTSDIVSRDVMELVAAG